MSARELGILVAVAAAIAGLVGIVWRVVAGRRSRPRSRPAAPDDLDHWYLERARHHENLRRIAASDYRPKRHEPERKERP